MIQCSGSHLESHSLPENKAQCQLQIFVLKCHEVLKVLSGWESNPGCTCESHVPNSLICSIFSNHLRDAYKCVICLAIVYSLVPLNRILIARYIPHIILLIILGFMNRVRFGSPVHFRKLQTGWFITNVAEANFVIDAIKRYSSCCFLTKCST